MRKSVSERVGEVFGRLTILEGFPKVGSLEATVVALCVCGNIKEYLFGNVRSGHTSSCGCIQYKHGLHALPEYNVWQHMLRRTQDKSNKSYKHYGGRGIACCKRWFNFENFYVDMGDRPTSAHSLERRNNNAGYSKKNCIWATAQEQSRNRRNNIQVRILGRQVTLKEASELTGINYSCLWQRVKTGVSPEKAVAMGAPKVRRSK